MRFDESQGYVCLAIYKPRADLLEEQIRSLQNQTLSEWKCLIGIDGYDESAYNLARQLVHDDSRFTVSHYTDRLGFYRNFERLLNCIPKDADWIALCDQDDFWHPAKLETLVPLLDKASLAMGQARLVHRSSSAGVKFFPRETAREMKGVTALLIDNAVTGSLCVFRGDLLSTALPFPPETDVAFHDHWLGICAAVSDGVVTSSQVVQDYHQHDQNVIGEESTSKIGRRIRYLADRTGSKSFGTWWTYLAEHRWKWRVNMCRCALSRNLRPLQSDLAVLEIVARGRMSVRLGILFLTAVIRKRAPFMRAMGLLLGALGAQRTVKKGRQ